jgi:hypothetical protein
LRGGPHQASGFGNSESSDFLGNPIVAAWSAWTVAKRAMLTLSISEGISAMETRPETACAAIA